MRLTQRTRPAHQSARQAHMAPSSSIGPARLKHAVSLPGWAPWCFASPHTPLASSRRCLLQRNNISNVTLHQAIRKEHLVGRALQLCWPHATPKRVRQKKNMAQTHERSTALPRRHAATFTKARPHAGTVGFSKVPHQHTRTGKKKGPRLAMTADS